MGTLHNFPSYFFPLPDKMLLHIHNPARIPAHTAQKSPVYRGQTGLGLSKTL